MGTDIQLVFNCPHFGVRVSGETNFAPIIIHKECGEALRALTSVEGLPKAQEVSP